MNLKVILPDETLTISEWMCKHNVSTHHCSLGSAISRAINYLDSHDMIKEITIFKTGDGSVFKTLEKAQNYDELLKKCDDITNSIISRPNDLEFDNGIGWLQHPEGTKNELEENIISLYNERFKSDVTNIDYAVGRTIDDNNIKCLNHLLSRWQCMSENNREYGQPYYARNIANVRGGQIN